MRVCRKIATDSALCINFRSSSKRCKEAAAVLLNNQKVGRNKRSVSGMDDRAGNGLRPYPGLLTGIVFAG
jgi:hypothetical protein